MSAMESSTSTPQQDNPPASVSPPPSESKSTPDGGILAKGKKLFGLGKKNVEETNVQDSDRTETTARTTSPTLLPSPPLAMDRKASPRGSPHMRPLGASPNRRIRSASPGLHSPASSQIFERSVQEPEPSVDVPAHIKTDDYIPPALDASSLAITDDHLNPDEVEIVMHSAHQPASAAVAGGMADSMYSSLAHDDLSTSALADGNETNSGYGSLDMTDPRRLSFISFADVVQAEQIESDRQELLSSASGEALQFMSLSSTANRSPSPVWSPAPSHALSASPPTSGAASPKSPTGAGTHSPPLSGELPLQIETMRQALRKTHSGDLSGFRSQPLSAVSLEDSAADKPPFK